MPVETMTSSTRCQECGDLNGQKVHINIAFKSDITGDAIFQYFYTQNYQLFLLNISSISTLKSTSFSLNIFNISTFKITSCFSWIFLVLSTLKSASFFWIFPVLKHFKLPVFLRIFLLFLHLKVPFLPEYFQYLNTQNYQFLFNISSISTLKSTSFTWIFTVYLHSKVPVSLWIFPVFLHSKVPVSLEYFRYSTLQITNLSLNISNSPARWPNWFGICLRWLISNAVLYPPPIQIPKYNLLHFWCAWINIGTVLLVSRV